MSKITSNHTLLSTSMSFHGNMWYMLALSTVVISLMVLGSSGTAFADVFSQNPIVIEHTNILNITDASIPPATNTIQVIVKSPPLSSNKIHVDLYRIGASNNFRSEFINFTSSPTDDNLDKLHVIVGDDVKVERGLTFWTAPVITNTSTLDPTFNTAVGISLLLTRSNSACTTAYGPGGTDSDNDYICNNWETTNDLSINYPSGANYHIPCNPSATYSTDPLGRTVCALPTEKDMFIEIDYMKGHKPDIDALKNVVTAFRNAPVNKINLHIFLDEQLDHVNGIIFPGTDPNPGFLQLKAKKFGTEAERLNSVNWALNYTAKGQVFQYFLWGHDTIAAGQPVGSKPSGVSDGANDGTVTLGSFVATVDGARKQQEGTFMHELGHNLGLGHGGGKYDAANCVPNMISVMNYEYQFGDLAPGSILDYSRSAIGTNTPGSTTLGWENAPGFAGGPMNVADSVPSNLYMVYGIGNGQTSYKQLPQTLPSSNNWPTPWQSIRYLADSQGNVFCPAPTTAVELKGVNQWALVKISHSSSGWYGGRGDSSLSASGLIPIKSYYSLGNDMQVHGKIFTISKESASSKEPTSELFSISTDKLDYSLGEPIIINGKVPISPNNIQVQGKISTEEPVFLKVYPNVNLTSDKIYPESDGTFSTALDSGMLNQDLYKIEAAYQNQTQIVFINIKYPNFDIPEGSWCITIEEAQKQVEENDNLNLEDAPICYVEITEAQVRAARVINTDNMDRFLDTLDNEYFANEKSKSILSDAIKDIRNLVSSNQIYSSIERYNEFIDLTKTHIINPDVQQELIDMVNFNKLALGPRALSVSEPDHTSLIILLIVGMIIIGLIIFKSTRSHKGESSKESDYGTKSDPPDKSK